MSSRILPQFDLLAPQSLSEAVAMLDQYRNEVSVLGGGTDLLVGNFIGKNESSFVLSLSALKDLDYINHVPGEGLRIGAKAKVAQLLANPIVSSRFPALHEAAVTFATPQIRNMATVVGNLLRASPAGDCSCSILALGGEVVLESSRGRRTVDIDDFWISYGVTSRLEDELAVEIRVSEPSPSTRSAFQRLTRTHEDLAKINVAVRLEMDQSTCRDARIAMGCVGPTPMRLKRTEAILKGNRITEATLRQVAESVREEIQPIDDQRSTADYRRQVAGVILRRTIERALEN